MSTSRPVGKQTSLDTEQNTHSHSGGRNFRHNYQTLCQGNRPAMGEVHARTWAARFQDGVAWCSQGLDRMERKSGCSRDRVST